MTSLDPTPRFDLKETTTNRKNSDYNNEELSEPVLAKATSLLFNSGNVVSSDRLKKKTNLNPQEEVN